MTKEYLILAIDLNDHIIRVFTFGQCTYVCLQLFSRRKTHFQGGSNTIVSRKRVEILL